MAQLQPYCAIEGNDDGLPVVFVHGMGVDHRSLMMLDKAFDGNDSIRRIYLDLPGFGRTPALPSMPAGCRKWRIGCKRPLTVLSVKRLHSPWSATRWAVRLSAKYWRANLAEWPVWH